MTEEGPGTGGSGPVGGDDGGGLLDGNSVAATDLGEHGDIALEFEGETGLKGAAEPADADDSQPVAEARRDGLFRRLLDVRLVGVPGMWLGGAGKASSRKGTGVRRVIRGEGEARPGACESEDTRRTWGWAAGARSGTLAWGFGRQCGLGRSREGRGSRDILGVAIAMLGCCCGRRRGRHVRPRRSKGEKTSRESNQDGEVKPRRDTKEPFPTLVIPSTSVNRVATTSTGTLGPGRDVGLTRRALDS